MIKNRFLSFFHGHKKRPDSENQVFNLYLL